MNIEEVFALLALIAGVIGLSSCEDVNSDHIDQLCDSTIDLACVRKYFSEHGRCSVVNKVKENPSYDVNFPIYVPNINLTSVATKTVVSNLDGKIQSFYKNKKTGNVVISVNFKGLSVHAPEAIFAVSQNGKEPKVLRENLNATYPMILTAVIPASHRISKASLRKAEYFAYFPETPTLVPGPKFTNSEDPVIAATAAAFMADVPTSVQEIFKTKASFDFLVYLQNYICNFHLSPVLHKYDTTALLNINRVSSSDKKRHFEPCADKDDVTTCVSSFFGDLKTCSVVRRPSNKPLIRSRVVIDVPRINSSVVPIHSKLTGLNGNIEEFYINNQTRNLVISVKFDSVFMFSPKTQLVMRQVGKEPKVISDYDTGDYPVTITAVIPKSLSSWAINKAYVSAYLPEPSKFELGPKFTNSKDSLVLKILKDVAANLPTISKEILLTEAPVFLLAYIQKYLCDFGIPYTV